MNYFFNTPLEGRKLEQVVRGSYVSGAGKRVDAFLKTQGIVSALSFGEIKTHKTNLIEHVINSGDTILQFRGSIPGIPGTGIPGEFRGGIPGTQY